MTDVEVYREAFTPRCSRNVFMEETPLICLGKPACAHIDMQKIIAVQHRTQEPHTEHNLLHTQVAGFTELI